MPHVLKNIIKAAVILLILSGIYWWWTSDSFVRYGAGILAPDEPVQENLGQASGFLFKDYLLTPQANFEVHARVLSARQYRRGQESDLSPIDFALGWGPMSDESVIEQINIKQVSRFYIWRVRDFPVPRNQIEYNSSNMHMIPATPAIERKMKQVNSGEIVRFRGKLVNVESTDGWRWRTSTSRTDTGNGACEIVYVEEFEVVVPS